MNTPNSCPQCGAKLPEDAPEALCPACLLSSAIPSDSEATMKLTGANTLAKGAALPSMFPFDFGGYRMLSLLGRGGMGAVYEAEQCETGRRVALKVLGEELDSEEMRKRFLREGRLAAAVTHPNSLYIFGTEEIEGTPVIVMEIAGGGTLKDELKRRGPLPVKEAVDAMLQIIAGLEAAHAGGVLHRDVKPANCFLAPDGTAKVGDFGLSVSTLARQESQLTASGMMLGTPSFAPPEQLRGDDLNVRADIYSVGATLYTLLTGKAPFDGVNAVQVVAAVLDKAPPSVLDARKDVPAGLAQVISRCMAKKREARFAGYPELRDALLPFSSQMPEPAPLGLRFLAGFVDDLLAALPEIVLATAMAVEFSDQFLSDRSSATFLPWFGFWLCYLAYFTISEGLWGAGIGKAFCGLRVVGPDGHAPGIGRALIRVLVFDLAALSTCLPLMLTTGPEYAAMIEDGSFFGRWWFWVPVIGFIPLFVTMRRSNGFAALQDLLSGTRVVRRAKASTRPRPKMSEVDDEGPADGEHIGPYVVVKPLGDGWLLAHDPALRRRVWIQRGADVPRMSEARRNIARPGRLRWLGGTTEWDAFEAPAGQPLTALENQSQPWAAVRWWLADLAEELAAAEKDGTLPGEISIDQVWITREGRAVLLDDKERGLPSPAEAQQLLASAAPCNGAQALLDAVAKQALDPKTVPLHARDVLQKITGAAFDRLSFLAGNLQSLLSKPGEISIRRRAASLLLVPLLLLFGVVLVNLSLKVQEQQVDEAWRVLHPDLPPLSAVLRLREASDTSVGNFLAWRPDAAVHYATQVHLVRHYRERLADALSKPDDENPELPLSADERQLLRQTFASYGMLTPGQIEQSDATLRKGLPEFIAQENHRPLFIAAHGLRNILAATAIIQFISLLFFGVTPGQKMFGFSVVNKHGETAGRLRMLGRWFIGWAPFLLAFLMIETTIFWHLSWTTEKIVKVSAFLLVWVLGLIAAILDPPQGLHDDQAKTWLVPR